MKILELELAQVAVRRLARESFGPGNTLALRQAVEAYQLIVQAEETIQLGDQAGLISLRFGYEQTLARLYQQWLSSAELLNDQKIDDNKLVAKFRHCIAQAQDWLEVHATYRHAFASAHETESLVLL